jgi:L-lactate dehydrogenase complex protein LldG
LPGARRERPVRPPILQATTGPANLADAFAAELCTLLAHVYSPAGPAEALDILLGIVRDSGAQAALAWDDEHLPLAGVRQALAAAGVPILDSTLPGEAAARTARLALLLDRAAVGITGALAGLADTGSVALLSGPGRGRLVSLLPPVHVALLPVTDLYPSLAAFFAAHPGLTRQASNLLFVTGPSRTADIEQVLTLGVHGPREVHVLLIPETNDQ